MAPRSKTRAERRDEYDPDDRGQRARQEDTDERVAFENSPFTDAAESPLYIPKDEWPEGKALRWIRVEANGAPDNTNWSKMTRVGWSPVPRKMYDKRFPVVPMPGVGDNSDGAIIFGGLCLCQRDIRLVKRDAERQQEETRLQGQSIETYVEGGNPNFPRRVMEDSGMTRERVRPVAFKE